MSLFQTSPTGTYEGKIGELKLTFYGAKKLPPNQIYSDQSRDLPMQDDPNAFLRSLESQGGDDRTLLSDENLDFESLWVS